ERLLVERLALRWNRRVANAGDAVRQEPVLVRPEPREHALLIQLEHLMARQSFHEMERRLGEPSVEVAPSIAAEHAAPRRSTVLVQTGEGERAGARSSLVEAVFDDERRVFRTRRVELVARGVTLLRELPRVVPLSYEEPSRFDVPRRVAE